MKTEHLIALTQAVIIVRFGLVR